MTTFKFDSKLDDTVARLKTSMGSNSTEDTIVKAINRTAAGSGLTIDSSATAKEIPSSTRLTLAYILLVGIAALFGMAGFFLLHAPADKAVQAQLFFDFAKSFGPPIVTLVIGYYFGDKSE